MDRGRQTAATHIYRDLKAGDAGRRIRRALSGRRAGAVPATHPRDLVRLSEAGYTGLIVLALALPFEFTQRPLLQTRFLTLTNVKLVLYVVAALAVAQVIRLREAARDDMERRGDLVRYLARIRVPLGLFAALALCCLLSTFWASAKGEGLKWTLDVLVGGVLWLVIPLWLARDRTRRMRALAAAIVAGAVIASVVGILEFSMGAGFADSLSWFKPKPTLAGSFLRLSGTFQYANIAAMYLELALPLAVAGLVDASAPPRRSRLVPLWAASVVVLLEALLLTYSRGALLGLAAMAAATMLIVRRNPHLRLVPGQARVLAATAGLALAIGAVTLASTPLALLRFTSQSDQEWYSAEYQSRVPPVMVACQRLTLPVTVDNHSPFTWQPHGPHLYNLGYHWLYPTGKVALFENPRIPLYAPVAPGAAQSVRATIRAPSKAGHYLLVWDMVQENITWFSLKRAAYVGYPVLVRGPTPDSSGAACRSQSRNMIAARRGAPTELPRTLAQPGRAQLWTAALRMLERHPLLGVGPDGYRLQYGAYMRPPLRSWDTRILANELFLELFADLGLLGGGLFLGFLFAVWWPLIVAVWTRGGSAPDPWQIGLIAALAAFLGHGLVDYLLESHAIFLVLWLFCGLVTAMYIHVAPAKRE